jgi:hypothetical protein
MSNAHEFPHGRITASRAEKDTGYYYDADD